MDKFLPHSTFKLLLPPVDDVMLLLCTAGNFLGAGDPHPSETRDRNAAAGGCTPS